MPAGGKTGWKHTKKSTKLLIVSHETWLFTGNRGRQERLINYIHDKESYRDGCHLWHRNGSGQALGKARQASRCWGTKGLGTVPAYSSTKRFQSHYLECLSQQAHMRHLNISITDIRPGFVKTDLIAGSNYPLQLDAQNVARNIVKAIEKGKSVKVIDWRYSILVFFWRLIPQWIWTRMKIAKWIYWKV